MGTERSNIAEEYHQLQFKRIQPLCATSTGCSDNCFKTTVFIASISGNNSDEHRFSCSPSLYMQKLQSVYGILHDSRKH
uniref:Uncharacterized protein n=1 Tax=Rhizophora mucronata TaxID=61149 RepID=A0A2P2IS56_RHIMU